MDSDKENIEVAEQAQESVHPVLCFDNMLDDQIVTGFSQGRQATVESVEKRGAQPVPRKLAAFDAAAGKSVRGAQMVDGEVPGCQPGRVASLPEFIIRASGTILSSNCLTALRSLI
jgi:hypothetical protein